MKQGKGIPNTLGMFDLLKGCCMLLIVLIHIRGFFPDLLINKDIISESDGLIKQSPFLIELPIYIRYFVLLLLCFLNTLMPVLLIIAGYSFRKRSIKKAFKQYAKELVKPYIYTVIATVLLNCVMHYCFFRYLPGAVEESLKVLGGMSFGFSQTTTLGNLTLFANGPVWYLLAMFWSLVIYNIVSEKAKEKYIPYIVFILSIIGWLLSYIKFTPFCISQGLVGITYIYIGYVLKKRKFFQTQHSLKWKLIYIVTVIIPNIFLTLFGMVTEMADNVYALGPVSYVENGLLGILLLYLVLRLNVFRGKIFSGLRTIGRYSLYIMCIHTIEMIAIPWYFLAEKFNNCQMAGLFIIYGIKLLIIFIGCIIVIKAKRIIIRIRKKETI